MLVDPEIKAMSECHQALVNIDDDSKIRVIQWVIGKFNLTPISKPTLTKESTIETIHILPEPDVAEIATENLNASNIKNYQSIADIFTKANAKTDAEKVLVVAAYLQVKNDLQDFMSFDVQKELKHMGHGVSNITRSIEILESKKPKLIIQTRKEGKSKQAKKRYKVTLEGLNVVKDMLKSN